MVNNLLDSSIRKSQSRKKNFRMKKKITIKPKKRLCNSENTSQMCTLLRFFLSKKMPFVPLWPMQTSSDYNEVSEI